MSLCEAGARGGVAVLFWIVTGAVIALFAALLLREAVARLRYQRRVNARLRSLRRR